MRKESKKSVWNSRWMAFAMLFTIYCSLFVGPARAQKREMRGAWIQCVNGQFQGMGTQKMQQTLTYQLD